MEHALVKIEKDYRIHIPKILLSGVGWVPENNKGASVLVGDSGRCRLLTGTEVQDDPDCRRLREEIGAVLEEPLSSLLSFREESVTALPLRLLPVDIFPHGAGYRMTLPKLLTGILQVWPGKDSVAVIVNQAHIEIWSLETLRIAVTPRLGELL